MTFSDMYSVEQSGNSFELVEGTNEYINTSDLPDIKGKIFIKVKGDYDFPVFILKEEAQEKGLI